MNCTSCGGRLKHIDGLYICENCRNKQTLSAFFENTEVFICYVEDDGQGRRSRDSVIAQDLYTKLESAKIKTFYQRISAGDLTGSDYKKAYMEAFDKAKILLILGTTAGHFRQVLEAEFANFSGKKIIPIYAGMNACDMPKELSELQAINYDSVGAVSDLIKNLLHMLGRENEIDVVQIVNERVQKRKRITVTIVCVVLIVLFTVGTYAVFGTPYVLKSKKYDYAANLLAQGSLVEAAEVYRSLEDYRNAANMLKSIYDKYDGYYENEDATLNLHLDIIDNKTVLIEIVCIDDYKRYTKANANAEFSGGQIEFHLSDDRNYQGKGTIELRNDGIMLTTVTDFWVNDISLGDRSVFFSFSAKTDAPLTPSITAETLREWLSKPMRISDFSDMGYELEYIDSATYGGDNMSFYKIKDVDIELTFGYSSAMYVEPGMVVRDEEKLHEVLSGVSTTAGIACPDQIEKGKIGFIMDDIFLYITSDDNGFSINDDGVENASTSVSIIPRLIVGELEWEKRIQNLREVTGRKQ